MKLDIPEAAQFILTHYPISQTWEPDAVPNWLHWAASKSLLVTVYDDEHKLAGLAIMRPLAEVNENTVASDDYDEDGDIIFLDLVIGESTPIRQSIGFGIISRLGQRTTVAFRRNGKLKTHSISNARKALFKLRLT